ncbi:tyrosine-protein phosphatase [Salisediminibacterium selenitireducens]|uniref:Tyrosine-protein phosphatase n=1 Tax=Bacillus selenitireducens (strain ATCC 700615 / DSM 15326 / MLS10) TaxID=439292 RepID=D6Y033_BACIE|nr:CpsB/CapC family capsule biosynthesis tyrosine phosphatase [Salisediminibacterium selenitireducens]ADI00535.1 Protein-tyrosine-phosphatase [[Bacillus] selenitireducens MLS10]
MIDIHCHIIPGIDDGPKDMASSILMARKAEEEGITTIIATPHRSRVYVNDAEDVRRLTAELQEHLRCEGLSLQLLPGQEPRISGELIEELQDGRVMPLTGTGHYVFVEFPFDVVPRYAKQLLFDLQLEGYVPVIVHPERNVQLREHPSVLLDFVRNGALTQVTAGSLTGRFGKKVQTYSKNIVRARQCHFLASDAHDTVKRNFHMAEAKMLMVDEFGGDHFDIMMANATAVVNGEAIYPEAPVEVKQKKWFGLF